MNGAGRASVLGPRSSRGPRKRPHSSRGPKTDARPAASAPNRRMGPLRDMSSHDCTVLALLLVERLSLTEASAALDMPVARLRRDYEVALAHVRRSIAPVMARADLARALTRPAPAWRRAS